MTVKPHPLEGKTVTGWWGVVNKHMHVSEVYNMRAFSEGALVVRGDRKDCLLVEVEIVIKRVVKSGRSK